MARQDMEVARRRKNENRLGRNIQGGVIANSSGSHQVTTGPTHFFSWGRECLGRET